MSFSTMVCTYSQKGYLNEMLKFYKTDMSTRVSDKSRFEVNGSDMVCFRPDIFQSIMSQQLEEANANKGVVVAQPAVEEERPRLRSIDEAISRARSERSMRVTAGGAASAHTSSENIAGLSTEQRIARLEERIKELSANQPSSELPRINQRSNSQENSAVSMDSPSLRGNGSSSRTLSVNGNRRRNMSRMMNRL